MVSPRSVPPGEVTPHLRVEQTEDCAVHSNSEPQRQNRDGREHRRVIAEWSRKRQWKDETVNLCTKPERLPAIPCPALRLSPGQADFDLAPCSAPLLPSGSWCRRLSDALEPLRMHALKRVATEADPQAVLSAMLLPPGGRVLLALWRR
jgi:hypothetical protein